MTSRNSATWIGFGAFALALGAGALFLATSMGAGPKGIPLGAEGIASANGANQDSNKVVIVKQGWEYTRGAISGGGTGNTNTPTSPTMTYNSQTYYYQQSGTGAGQCSSCTGVHANNNAYWWWDSNGNPVPDCVVYNTTPCP